MVDGIRGRTGSLAHEAMLAALKRQAEAAEQVRGQAAEVSGAPSGAGTAAGPEPSAKPPSFADAVRDGVAEVETQLRSAEALPADMVTGGVQDFSEVATRLKSAELTFRFSMEIRNKLIDAYREVMRMQV